MSNRKLKNKIYRRLLIKYKDANIERLTSEQIMFITQGISQNCYLEACPGSGKTEVVGLKAAYEINNWKQKFSGIAIVSFTNTAAKEIENRARKYAGIKATTHPHFIGTFDSFFYKYILFPFFYGCTNFKGIDGDFSPRTIVDEKSNAGFLNHYKTKTSYPINNGGYIPIFANKFYYDLIKKDFYIFHPTQSSLKPISLQNFISKYQLLEKFPGLTKKIICRGFIKTKLDFWEDGFVTFRDAEFLIYQILKKKKGLLKNFARRFPLIIIDECQDLSPNQLVILKKLLNEGINLILVGDLNQSIFEFREVNPNLVKKFIYKNNFKRLNLTNNFRSNQIIVNVFDKIFSINIKGNEKTILANSLILLEYEESQIPKLVDRYKEIINEANNEANNEIIKIENSAIIIRGSTLIKKFKPSQNESRNPLTNLAHAIYFWSLDPKTPEIMERALYLMGKFLSNVFYSKEGNAKNFYCLENISYAEWRIFLASLLDDLRKKYFPFKDKNGNDITFSEFGKQIRDNLKNFIEKLPVEPFIEANGIDIRVESGKGQIIINNDVPNVKVRNNIRVTTIHDIKGETLDSAMVVSSLNGRSQGGYWKHWFKDKTDNEAELEYKRYGYVAFSRAKHLLVLATPKLKKDEIEFFKNIGFKVENL